MNGYGLALANSPPAVAHDPTLDARVLRLEHRLEALTEVVLEVQKHVAGRGDFPTDPYGGGGGEFGALAVNPALEVHTQTIALRAFLPGEDIDGFFVGREKPSDNPSRVTCRFVTIGARAVFDVVDHPDGSGRKVLQHGNSHYLGTLGTAATDKLVSVAAAGDNYPVVYIEDPANCTAQLQAANGKFLVATHSGNLHAITNANLSNCTETFRVFKEADWRGQR